MDETDMEHGRDWTGQDVGGWLVSEKLDGVRAYWDGATLWSRSGRAIPLPAYLARQLPVCHLDGELWAGRGGFQQARDAANHGSWSPAVHYMVFDRPDATGAWPCRLGAALRAITPGFARVVNYTIAPDLRTLLRLLAGIQRVGGEGLMLRAPECRHYYRTRVCSLLKLKRA